jgi:hypothetical protein
VLTHGILLVLVKQTISCRDSLVDVQMINKAQRALEDVMMDECEGMYSSKFLALRAEVDATKLEHADIQSKYDRQEQRSCVKVRFEDALKSVAGSQHAKTQARIHKSFALFCDSEMECEGSLETDDNTFVHVYVQSMIKAMSLGSQDAHAHFPRVLDFVQRHWKTVSKPFSEGCQDVPAGMFLEWLPQIVSLIAHGSFENSGHLMVPLLLRVSQDFPQTVYYALRVVRNDIKKVPERWKQLSDIMDSPAAIVAEEFARNVQLLQNPEDQVRVCQTILCSVTMHAYCLCLFPKDTQSRLLLIWCMRHVEQTMQNLTSISEKRKHACPRVFITCMLLL